MLLTILIKALYMENNINLQPNKDAILVIIECIRMLEAAKPKCVRNVLNKLKQCEEFKSKNKFKETLETL